MFRPRPPLDATLNAALLALACMCAGGAQAMPFEDGLASQTASLGRQVRDSASDVVLTAMNFLGVPYKRGGNDADAGFDCSGFTRHVYESTLGLPLPRRADEQAKAPGFQPVKRHELRPGDLVFFNTLRRTFSHVGIYVGDGKFIHAPRAGGEVRVEHMGMKYWARRFTGARRAPQTAQASVSTTAAPTAPTTAAAPAPGAAPVQPGFVPELAEVQASQHGSHFHTP